MSVCDAKSTYPSFTRAQSIAKRRMRDDHTVVLRVYRCNECGLWHLTSRPDRFARER